MEPKAIQTPILEIAYYENGPTCGWPVILSHGFLYDIHAFDDVVPLLLEQGARVIVPYLRGFGPTRFWAATSPRVGQQAALGQDIIHLLDALGIPKAILAGFDWGGLASCVATCLWPERVAGLVSYAGYDVIDRKAQRNLGPPALEAVMWYQHYFQHERGYLGLSRDRRDLCRLLWQQWSPTRTFQDVIFERTAKSFDTPDFVAIVTHAYRHVLGNEDGDPKLEPLEERLAQKPKIVVPAITLDGARDPLTPEGSAGHASMFTASHIRRVYDVGHAFPMEAPAAFPKAILDVRTLDQYI